MYLIVHFIVLTLLCFNSLLLGTDAGKHGKLLKPTEPTNIHIPDALMSEFYVGIDTQEDKYVEALEKVKARKPHQNKVPKRKRLNTENELTVSRRNMHRPHRKHENTNKSTSTLDMGDFAKFSRRNFGKNITKSKTTKNRKKAKKDIYKHITPNVGENSPIDIIIHIKMRDPKQSVDIEAK